MAKEIINVAGMSCSHCEHTVKTAVGALNGVSNVVVKLKTGKVTVDYDPEKIDIKTIKTIIEDEGYEVTR